MESNPFVIVPIGLIAAGGLLLFSMGAINLAILWTTRKPEVPPFGAIRHRAISFQQLLIPGLLALLTGLMVSLSASFLFEGLTTDSDATMLKGLLLFVVTFITFSVVGAFLLKSANEISDLAKDPVTIASAANFLRGNTAGDEEILHSLQANYATWLTLRGVRAFSANRRTGSDSLNRALEARRTAGRLRWWWSWRYLSPRLLLPTLRAFPSFLGGPLLAVIGLAVASIAIGSTAGSNDPGPWYMSVAFIALTTVLASVFHWWTELLGATRRYELMYSVEMVAERALAGAQARIAAEVIRARQFDAIPLQIRLIESHLSASWRTRWLAVATGTGVGAVGTAGLLIAAALMRRRP